MKLLTSLNPLWIFATGALGFVGWVVYDATRTPGGTAMKFDQPMSDDKPALMDVKLLSMIQPGQSQAEVRQHLRQMHLPFPDEIGPVDLSAGYPAYHVRYRVTLVRPLPQAKAQGTFKPGPHIMTLLFDARQAGHPLVSITTVPEAEPKGPATTVHPM